MAHLEPGIPVIIHTPRFPYLDGKHGTVQRSAAFGSDRHLEYWVEAGLFGGQWLRAEELEAQRIVEQDTEKMQSIPAYLLRHCAEWYGEGTQEYKEAVEQFVQLQAKLKAATITSSAALEPAADFAARQLANALQDAQYKLELYGADSPQYQDAALVVQALKSQQKREAQS